MVIRCGGGVCGVGAPGAAGVVGGGVLNSVIFVSPPMKKLPWSTSVTGPPVNFLCAGLCAARATPNAISPIAMETASRFICHQLRMKESISSRFSSISSCVVASRFKRSIGSVFEPRTLKCQSAYSTEQPSSA